MLNRNLFLETYDEQNAKHFTCDVMANVGHVYACSESVLEISSQFTILFVAIFFIEACICVNDVWFRRFNGLFNLNCTFLMLNHKTCLVYHIVC